MIYGTEKLARNATNVAPSADTELARDVQDVRRHIARFESIGGGDPLVVPMGFAEITTNPTGGADYTDSRYFVKWKTPTNSATAALALADDKELNTADRVVTAHNLAEFTAATHTIAAGEPVFIWGIVARTSRADTIYAFDASVGPNPHDTGGGDSLRIQDYTEAYDKLRTGLQFMRGFTVADGNDAGEAQVSLDPTTADGMLPLKCVRFKKHYKGTDDVTITLDATIDWRNTLIIYDCRADKTTAADIPTNPADAGGGMTSPTFGIRITAYGAGAQTVSTAHAFERPPYVVDFWEVYVDGDDSGKLKLKIWHTEGPPAGSSEGWISGNIWAWGSHSAVAGDYGDIGNGA